VQKWKDLIDSKDRELLAKDQEIVKLQSVLSANQLEQHDMQILLQTRMKKDYDESSLNSLRAAVQERGIIVEKERDRVKKKTRESGDRQTTIHSFCKSTRATNAHEKRF
jgi:uncharacterized membrane protein YebE (DUF533 family)